MTAQGNRGDRRDAAAAVAEPMRRAGAASPAATETVERQRIRLFVAGHVGAVTLVYLLAAWVGDGWAPPPFPPDLAAARTAAPLANAGQPHSPGAGGLAAPGAGPATGDAPAAPDIAAPWHTSGHPGDRP